MTVLEVYECEDKENIMFNRLIGVWRWGTVWEKCVLEGADYFYITYRAAGGDSKIDLDDALGCEQEKEAQKVAMITHTILKAVPLDKITFS